MPPVFITTLSLLLIVPLGIGIPFLSKDEPSDYEQDHTTWVYPPWEHTWGVVRATETHLDILTLGRADFDNPQGLDAVRLIATDDPDRKGDDEEVTVYGINSGENAIIYNKSMKSIGLYGYRDEGEGNLNQPWDVAATPEGLVFVTDSGNRRVVKLRNVKGDLRFERAFGDTGSFALGLPRGIEVTAYGSVMVADAAAGRVVVYDTSGYVKYAVGGLDTPVALAGVEGRDDFLIHSGKYVVVSDSGGQRLTKVGLDGEIIARRSVAELAGEDDVYIGHLDIDYHHNVIATDSSNHRLLKFDENLNFLSEWGRHGEGRGKFKSPTGITIWRHFGQVFVAHSEGAHYLWVGVDLLEPPELNVLDGQVITLDLRLSERARVELEIVDDAGAVLRTERKTRGPGDVHMRWPINTYHYEQVDGKLTRVFPTPLPSGEYTLRLRLRATYSSREAFEKVIETRVTLRGTEEG